MITRLIRKNILNLQPYSCARDEFEGDDAIFLDANENPYPNGCNRYPDPRQTLLKQRLAEIKDWNPEQIIVGNGSDEIIDLIIRSICYPTSDNIVVFSPGYSMYEVSAAINDIEVRKINLTPDFMPDIVELDQLKDGNTKIIFLCSPNNPTGNIIPLSCIEELCTANKCLVVVDEAYIDFSSSPSTITLSGKYPNLFILQTLSKSWGMAGLRLGIGYGNKTLVDILNKVKAPYNVGSLAQQTALEGLNNYDDFARKLETIKSERNRLYNEFIAMGLFDRIYPSEANFILVQYTDYQSLYDYLVKNNMVVRLRNIPPLIKGGIRISIGTEQENDLLLDLLKQWKQQKYSI